MKNLSAVCFFYVTIAGSTASCLACVSLLDSSFKSMLWLAIAVATCMMLVRASSATKHLLWATTLLGLLLLPVATALLPEWRVLPGWFALEHRIEYATLVRARTDDPMERFAPENLPSVVEEEVQGPVEDNQLIKVDAANRSFAKSPYPHGETTRENRPAKWR